MTVRATDGGTEPGPLFTDSTLNIIFVPTQGEPVFSVNTAHVTFFGTLLVVKRMSTFLKNLWYNVYLIFLEKEVGLEESQRLPLAEDPKNYRCTDDCHVIYYRIIGKYLH